MLTGVLFNSLHENQPLIVAALLKGLKVNVSMETINDTLQSHPDYPSFLSISDSLNNWKVENLVIQTSAEKLSEIPTPFITIFKQGVFVIVFEVLENELLIVNQQGKKETIAKNVFLSQWTENILVAEANNSLLFSQTKEAFANNFIFALYALFIPTISWFLLKPLLKRLQVAKYEKRSYSMLKFNDDVFWSLLKNQPSIVDQSTSELGITIGNPNAKHTIIKVCNPYCGPCATVHPDIERIIESNPEVKAQIIFTATNHENDRGAKPVKHLLAVSEKGDENLTKNALDDWYLAKEKSYDVFANKYPMNGEIDKQTGKIDQMKEWCEKVKIEYTPTIFIDGFLLPKGYQIKDINYFLS